MLFRSHSFRAVVSTFQGSTLKTSVKIYFQRMVSFSLVPKVIVRATSTEPAVGNHPMWRFSLWTFSFQPCSWHHSAFPPGSRPRDWPAGGVHDVQSPGGLVHEGSGRGMGELRYSHWGLNCCYEEVNLGTDDFAVFPPVFRPNSPWPNSSQAPLYPLGLAPSLSGLHSPMLVRILPSPESTLIPTLSNQIIHPSTCLQQEFC